MVVKRVSYLPTYWENFFILCKTGEEEHGFKYILTRDFTCMVDGEIMGKVGFEVIERMPKAN